MSKKVMDKNPINKNRERLMKLVDIIKDCHEQDKEISTYEIIKELKESEIDTDRRALYNDFKVINSITNYRIVPIHRRYKIERNSAISKQELEIIENALSSSRFFTKSSTIDLIEKLYKIAGYKKEKGLLIRTPVEDSVKSHNEGFEENLKKIDEAIKNNKKIKFNYIKYDVDRDTKTRIYVFDVSPYAHSWYEDYYYMLGHYKDNKLSYYRIDKMHNIKLLDESRKKISDIDGCIRGLNVSEMLGKMVGMSSGREETIRIRLDKKLVGRIIDKFGDKTKVIKNEDDTVDVLISAIYNKELKPWILRFGDGAEVLEPKELREDIKATIDRMKRMYDR